MNTMAQATDTIIKCQTVQTFCIHSTALLTKEGTDYRFATSYCINEAKPLKNCQLQTPVQAKEQKYT